MAGGVDQKNPIGHGGVFRNDGFAEVPCFASDNSFLYPRPAGTGVPYPSAPLIMPPPSMSDLDTLRIPPARGPALCGGLDERAPASSFRRLCQVLGFIVRRSDE